VALHSAFASSISTSCDYSILVPAGQTVDLFGLQLEPQTSPGKYVANTSETGVYPNTRFDTSALAVTATGPGQSALTVSLLSKASR
jgi:hypothetical protein